jgi:hypothetical protein
VFESRKRHHYFQRLSIIRQMIKACVGNAMGNSGLY